MARFRNPLNNHVVHIDSGVVFILALLFGCIYFLVVGEIGPALGELVLAIVLIPTAIGPFVVWIVFALLAPSIRRGSFLKRGYIEETSVQDQSVEQVRRSLDAYKHRD